jgi:hypothetical protein
MSSNQILIICHIENNGSALVRFSVFEIFLSFLGKFLSSYKVMKRFWELYWIFSRLIENLSAITPLLLIGKMK